MGGANKGACCPLIKGVQGSEGFSFDIIMAVFQSCFTIFACLVLLQQLKQTEATQNCKPRLNVIHELLTVLLLAILYPQ